MEEAKIVVTDAEAYYEQGSLRFPVDPRDLWKTLGAGEYKEQGSVLDRLTDSSIVSLAVANGLPVDPYSRELLRSPLHGFIQLVWYRDIRGHTSDRLDKAQQDRVQVYLRRLQELRDRPQETEEGQEHHVRRANKFVRRFRVKPNVDLSARRGREAAILNLVRDLGEPSYADVVEAGKKVGKDGRPLIKSKTDLERVVTYFLNRLVKDGVVEEVGKQLEIR